MKKLSLVLCVGSIALLLGSCASSETTNSSPPTTPSPNPQSSDASQGANQPEGSTSTIKIPGLIPSTNPDQKRAKIIRGRVDPFALMALNPNITIKAEPEPIPPPQPPSSNPRARYIPRSTGSPRSSPAEPLPLPPPAEAEGVTVSGIVQLPSTPMAIVKAPDEKTERRVVPGSTLSNGRILVRSIDTNPDNPSIVLEQFGQTVIRKLGAGTQASTTNPQAVPPQSVMMYPEAGKGER